MGKSTDLRTFKLNILRMSRTLVNKDGVKIIYLDKDYFDEQYKKLYKKLNQTPTVTPKADDG